MELFSPYLEWLTMISIMTFLLSIILIPWYVAKLPRGFFLKIQTHHRHSGEKPLHIVLVLLRNIAGIILVSAGIAMLFLPGQGIITILIGVLCMSFPGKRNLLLYLLSMKTIKKSLNWTRNKLNRPPFDWQE